MGEIINYQSYEQYKRELDGELQKTAESFVRIGYLLKVARDTNILQGSGYDNVADFAKAEYGLDKTQVSRFISINTRFSVDGCSDRLLPEYQGYGYAKLTIMLQIPEEITQELTPAYTKAEIQAVKEEVDEEKKVSDLEIFAEKMELQQDEEKSMLWKVIRELGHDNPDLYEKIWEKLSDAPGLDYKNAAMIMAPNGDKNYSVRIEGVGRIMMTMKDKSQEITLTNVRTLEKEIYTTKDMAHAWFEVVYPGDSAGESWERTYQESWPKAKVAPVQPEKKPEPKKESKVQKAKMQEKPKKTSTEAKSAAAGRKGEQDGENVKPGMPDVAGDCDSNGEPERAEIVAGDEVPVLDEGLGAAEVRRRETDIERRNREFFELKKEVSDAALELSMITGDKFWDCNLQTMRKAYKLAVDAAAGMEQMAQRQGWSLHEE